MGIGPFTTYAPPGVYTQTIAENVIGQLLGGLRIPVLIGVGKETLSQTDFELVRGSSSVADTPIFNEDVSGRWVAGGTSTNPTLGNQDGTRTQFKVRNVPIVDGTGRGLITYDVTKVSVTVNGEQTVISALDGQNGLISLLVPPAASDVVLVTYFFHRKDTQITDDVSSQVTKGTASLVAPKEENYNIVADTSDTLEVTVDDQTTGTITLTAGTRAATQVASEINQAGISGLTASVHVDGNGLNHIQLNATGNIRIGSGNANGALGYNPGDYSNRTSSFRVFNGPIVDGSDGGITTTDPTKVVVKVNNLQVVALTVDGQNRLVTIPFAPVDGSTVTVQYYFNTFQDTFDYLPNNNITSVGNVGISPGRRDYINGVDFVVNNEGDQSKIQWGTAFQVLSGTTTGTTPFNTVQISGLLVDNRIYGVECERFSDPLTAVVSTTTFLLPITPTTGNGRDTPLSTSTFTTVTNGRVDLPTNRPDLVVVHVGKSWRDASSRPPVVVLEVDAGANTFTLRDSVPADYKAFATFWYNRIADDVYTFSVTTAGPAGVGAYTIGSQKTGTNLYGVKFGTKASLPQTVHFPSGSENLPDAFHTGAGIPVPETVTVTFSNTVAPATHASITNANAEPYDIYSFSRMFGGIIVDGSPAVSVDLSLAYAGSVLGTPVTDPLSMISTDVVVLIVDGIQIASVNLSSATTMAGVVTLINAAIDADTQTHSDGSSTFASTAPNNLATSISYGTEVLLKVKGRNSKSFTNGLKSNVKVVAPVTPGETDASAKLGLTLNQEGTGSYNAINQVATLVGTQSGPFSISAGVNDLVQINVDGNDISATLPSGTGVPLNDVVTSINDAYIAVASTTDIATYTADVVALSNHLRTKYETHRVSTVYHVASDATNAIAAPVASDLTTAITLLNDIKAKYNLHLTQSGVHQLDDSVNTLSTANATNLQTAVVLANDLKEALNHHYTQLQVHGHDDTTNSLTPAAVPVTNVQCYPILNDIKAKYNLHRVQSGVHVVDDTVNVVTSPDSFSQLTGEALANELKADINAHYTQTSVHGVTDTTNVITSPNANSPASLVTLTAELQAKYETHRTQTQGIYHVHGSNDVVNTITLSMSELIARNGAGENAGKLILTSRINTLSSTVLFKNTSTSADVLGFALGASAQRKQPTAANLAGALNNSSSFQALAIAIPLLISGLGSYLKIDSRTTGSTSTLAFTSVTNTAFVADTRVGITPGTTLDIGENAQSGFTVSSSQGTAGSHGTGFPGQTYTDGVTGLRFTILPSTSSDYASGGSFTFSVNQTFVADASIPVKAVAGVEVSVFNTNGMAAGTTAVVTTYPKTGAEPKIGDVYYISYEYQKSDVSTQVFREIKKIQSSFGAPTTDNPLSLAARLQLLNGAVLVGIKQVFRASGGSQASTSAFISAIDELKKPIAGTIKPDVITPLATDPQIFSYLNQHCIFMSSPRQEGERIGVVGCAAGTTALGVQSIARSLGSELMVVTYPDIYILGVQDSLGNTVDQVVDGSYSAAAVAGSTCNPSFDSATPWTRRSVQGFKRLGRILDPTESNQIAVAGVLIVEQVDAGMRVRHGLTTNVQTVITRTPSVTLTIHFVQQQIRVVLDPFIGQKLTGNLIKSVETSLVGLFTQLIDKEIVQKVAGIEVVVDEVDPTILRTSAIYVPVFPLEYIVSTLSIRVRI